MQEVVILANIDQDLYCYMMSLGHAELAKDNKSKMYSQRLGCIAQISYPVPYSIKVSCTIAN